MQLENHVNWQSYAQNNFLKLFDKYVLKVFCSISRKINVYYIAIEDLDYRFVLSS